MPKGLTTRARMFLSARKCWPAAAESKLSAMPSSIPPARYSRKYEATARDAVEFEGSSIVAEGNSKPHAIVGPDCPPHPCPAGIPLCGVLHLARAAGVG